MSDAIDFDVEPEMGQLWQATAGTTAMLPKHPLRIATMYGDQVLFDGGYQITRRALSMMALVGFEAGLVQVMVGATMIATATGIRGTVIGVRNGGRVLFEYLGGGRAGLPARCLAPAGRSTPWEGTRTALIEPVFRSALIESQFQIVGVDLARAGRDETATVALRRKIERPTDRAVIDAFLAEDARCYPAFAMARRAAVMEVDERAWTGSFGTMPVDRQPLSAQAFNHVLNLCRIYEEKRGGRGQPSAAALSYRGAPSDTRMYHALVAYESHRGARVDSYQARPTPEQESVSEVLERWGG